MSMQQAEAKLSFACPYSVSLDFGNPILKKDYQATEGFVKLELPKGVVFKYNGRKCSIDEMYCQFWNNREIVKTCPHRSLGETTP